MRDANDGRNIPRVELFCQRIILYSYKYMLDFFTIKKFSGFKSRLRSILEREKKPA